MDVSDLGVVLDDDDKEEEEEENDEGTMTVSPVAWRRMELGLRRGGAREESE